MIAYLIIDVHFFRIDAMMGSRSKLTLVDEFVPRDHHGRPNAILLDRLSGGFEKGKFAFKTHFSITVGSRSSLEDLPSMFQVDLRESKRAAAMAEKPRNRM